MLRRQLSKWTERTEKLREQSNQKAQEAKDKMHELRAIHRKLTEEHTDKGKEMEIPRVRIEQTEKKMLDLKENTENKVHATTRNHGVYNATAGSALNVTFGVTLLRNPFKPVAGIEKGTCQKKQKAVRFRAPKPKQRTSQRDRLPATFDVPKGVSQQKQDNAMLSETLQPDDNDAVNAVDDTWATSDQTETQDTGDNGWANEASGDGETDEDDGDNWETNNANLLSCIYFYSDDEAIINFFLPGHVAGRGHMTL
ncbi:kinetochore-associated Ndc80 complex subunit nuf2 [Conoideocrella luteorostrata]|uniref:Kinetochore-associated Ndc80 complex subunit nuf2 n=1 Tax=Conoideocrella luteorostrata TaxID=1105319 RepID=A0AAJ0CCB3_9HYPO|nr:kinetochore-associated Ndc80 complex subunit nuf2 [Conoideocrella luteorostrata]